MNEQHHTAWIIDTQMTVLPTDGGVPRKVPTGLLDNAGSFVDRLARYLHNNGQAEGTVLLTDEAANKLRWREPVAENGFQPALAELERHQWRAYSGVPEWTTCKRPDAPSVHIGLIDRLDAQGWTFGHPWWHVQVSAVQEWHRLSGHAWADGHPVMGVEMIHRTIRPWRDTAKTGNRKVAKTDGVDLRVPEGPFTPRNWRNPQPGHYLHGYDRRRAGLTASGAAFLPVTELANGWRKYDPKRAGHWQIEIPAWNMPELPSPAGPYKPGSIQWVESATLALIAEIADQGLIKFPDIRESWTAPGRPALLPFQKLLESVYQQASHDLVKNAAKEVAEAGIGMLNNPHSTFYRPSWYSAVNATKRANCWRTAWRVANTCNRTPVMFDDDALYYTSNLSDPIAAAPNGIYLKDAPGCYRTGATTVQKGKK